jgi:hypothetical protein
MTSGQVMRRTGSFPRLFLCGFTEAHAGAAAVLINECNALTDQRLFDQIERGGVPRIPSNLDVRNCVSMQTGGGGQVPDGPI